MMIRAGFVFAALWSIAAASAGTLYQPVYCLDHVLREPAKDYAPQPGDFILYTDDHNLFWDIGFKFALSGPPYHSGVVCRMPDGTLGTLEAGPDDSSRVVVCSLAERMAFHSCNRGRVWVRQRKVPLTECESCRLTEFALSEWGKPFAFWRMCGQTTLLRSRGPIRTNFMGKAQGPHDSYWCTELVLEACVYAGLLDPVTTRPAATLPRDLFFDRSINPYVNRHFNLSCTWEPPARWTPDCCPCCRAHKGSYKNPNLDGVAEHPYQASCRSNCTPAAISAKRSD